jgi:hypothetical protein
MPDMATGHSVSILTGRRLRTYAKGAWFPRHIVFILLFTVGVVLRALAMVAYRPAFLLQRDAYIYLERAVGTAGGPGAFRPALYPLAFLRPLLALDGLVLVALVQHVLGLTLAYVLYRLLLRLGAPRSIGALGAAPVLLDGYQIDLEHYILTEPFFQALVVAALSLLTWGTTLGNARATAAGAVLGLSGVTRFVGVALVVPALLYALARRAGSTPVIALLVGAFVPIALYSVWFMSSYGTLGITSRNGFFLYGRVASFADCRGMELPSELTRFCLRQPVPEGSNPGVFGLIDVNRLQRELPRANALLLDFSRRMILENPLAYARVVIVDFLRYFESRPPWDQERHALRWRFPRSLEDADPAPFVQRRGGSAPESMGLEPFSIDRRPAGWLRSYQNVVYTRGPLLALLLLLGVAGAVFGPRSFMPACLLFTLAASVLLFVPVATTVYHFRYVVPALPVAGAAGALGSAALLRRAYG